MRVSLRRLDFPQAQGWWELAVLPIETVHSWLRAAEMTKLLGLLLWGSDVLPPVQAPGRALKQARAAREQLMYFEAGQCVDATGFLVKHVLRSGVQTAITWRWNQVAMGCRQGGSRVHKPSHQSQACVAVREGLRSELAVLPPLDVQCPLKGAQDGYAVGVLAEAYSEILVL